MKLSSFSNLAGRRHKQGLGGKVGKVDGVRVREVRSAGQEREWRIEAEEERCGTAGAALLLLLLLVANDKGSGSLMLKLVRYGPS